MRNTDNTPGQMEATASTAEGKKRKPIFAGWDFGIGEDVMVRPHFESREFKFMAFIQPQTFDFSNAIIIDTKA